MERYRFWIMKRSYWRYCVLYISSKQLYGICFWSYSWNNLYSVCDGIMCYISL